MDVESLVDLIKNSSVFEVSYGIHRVVSDYEQNNTELFPSDIILIGDDRYYILERESSSNLHSTNIIVVHTEKSSYNYVDCGGIDKSISLKQILENLQIGFSSTTIAFIALTDKRKAEMSNLNSLCKEKGWFDFKHSGIVFKMFYELPGMNQLSSEAYRFRRAN